jgi:hypothetical protein
MKRECGECIACCVWPKIIELNKPHFALCQYLKNKIGCTKNCKIHDNRRPKACIDYNCEWLKGHGRKEDRPDKCGMMKELKILSQLNRYGMEQAIKKLANKQ